MNNFINVMCCKVANRTQKVSLLFLKIMLLKSRYTIHCNPVSYRDLIKMACMLSNYNRANDVAVWQPTPTMADVTITKIAGYVRVRFLMNR